MSGNELKIKLQTLGISMAKIAKILGVSSQAFNHTLQAADVKSGTIEKLCAALDLDITFFYTHTGARNTVVQHFSRQKAHNISNGSGMIVESSSPAQSEEMTQKVMDLMEEKYKAEIEAQNKRIESLEQDKKLYHDLIRMLKNDKNIID